MGGITGDLSPKYLQLLMGYNEQHRKIEKKKIGIMYYIHTYTHFESIDMEITQPPLLSSTQSEAVFRKFRK